jgi:hypothetical protein
MTQGCIWQGSAAVRPGSELALPFTGFPTGTRDNLPLGDDKCPLRTFLFDAAQELHQQPLGNVIVI